MKVPVALIALAIVGLVAAPAAADFAWAFTGHTGGGPLWNRPDGAGPTIRTLDQVHYRVHRFSLLDPSACTIYSTQGFDGYLHLYTGSFDPATPLVNLVDGDDNGELGMGSSRIPTNKDISSLNLPAGDVFVVVSGFANANSGPYQLFVMCNEQPNPTCYWTDFPRYKQVCLLNRFAVKIDSVTNSPSGQATAVPSGSNDSAFFWFYADSNYEVLLKILDACAVNGYYWVFFAGTTNQGFHVHVRDVLEENVTKTYEIPLGPPAAATTDVTAFRCSPQ